MGPEITRKQPIKRETLADRVAEDITESILSGTLDAGSTLPTEPELAAQYGVSRSVIRDATRLLSARGLVDVQHGKGVFVTASQDESFADALLLALRRDGATAWDYIEFSEPFTPMIVSLAAANATEEEIDEIEHQAKRMLDALVSSNIESPEDLNASSFDEVEDIQRSFYNALFSATHNKILQRLAVPLHGLRRLNIFDIRESLDTDELPDVTAVDRRFFDTVISCLRSRDPARAFKDLWKLVQFPPEAIKAMKETPIGESPYIVLESSAFHSGKEEAADG